jgi:hypothetical protein
MDYFASARSIASNNKIDPTRIEIIQQWRIGLTSKCKIKDIRGVLAFKFVKIKLWNFIKRLAGDWILFRFIAFHYDTSWLIPKHGLSNYYDNLT